MKEILKIVFIEQTLLKVFLVHKSEICCQQCIQRISLLSKFLLIFHFLKYVSPLSKQFPFCWNLMLWIKTSESTFLSWNFEREWQKYKRVKVEKLCIFCRSRRLHLGGSVFTLQTDGRAINWKGWRTEWRLAVKVYKWWVYSHFVLKRLEST